MTRLAPERRPAQADRVPRPRYDHLRRLTDGTGLFEHALHDVPRTSHGYCTDDVARALLVIVREPERTEELTGLTSTYLTFLRGAIEPAGLAHNRMSVDGSWTDEAGSGDWWGRATHACGVASVLSADPWTRSAASALFGRAAQRDPVGLRPGAFAALGAGAVLMADPSDGAARRILERFVASLPAGSDAAWPWPEPRLRYANGSIVEAVIVAGRALGDEALLARGLTMLTFLVDAESRLGHLSVAGTAGRGPDDHGPLFDQQPIEVAAIADACVAAFAATADPVRLGGARLAWGWFMGANDSATRMVDLATGAGFDGLEPAGRNDNRGAESTLAALSCWQHARRYGAGSEG